MKPIISAILFILALAHGLYAEIEISFSEQPDWKVPILDNVTFLAEVKDNKELLGENADRGDGFIVFSCTAKENLKSRLLWVDAELTFSDGYKRKFENIKFMIIKKGTQYDIRKVPFERDLKPNLFSADKNETTKLEVTKMHITSVAIK